jgi:type IV pilus assembly protein PilA
MKLNKKGFTLVELLAVIVILLAISVVAIPSISAGIERSKTNTDEKKKTILTTYGEIYLNEHPSASCVTINTLLNEKYITADEAKSELSNSQFTGAIKCDKSTGIPTNCIYKENCN